MHVFKRAIGKILYFIARFISIILNGLIKLIEVIVTFVINIGKGLFGIISMSGCLIFFILGPFGIALLLHPVTLIIIFFLVAIPILGTKSVSYLKYLKYMITEYLFDRANYLIDGKKNRFKSFNEYGNKYRKMEEERRKGQQQQRQYEQQRMWEERFRQWNEYQNSQKGSGGYGHYSWYGQNAGYDNGQTFINPTIEFKDKYEKSCDLLGVSYDSDKYQIKLAYRKKAKQYHPDLNKSENATKMFQQINDAYEFLSDANIERYQNIK